MKRYIIGLTLMSALSMGLTSCSDFLDEPIRGQQDMTNYFTTEEECAKQITGCYNFLDGRDWWQIYKFYNLCNITTDDCWMGNTTQDPGEYRVACMFTGNTIDLGNACQNFWQYRYKGITQCNIAIEKIPQIKFNDEKVQKRLVAEAKFLRGFYYLDLVKNFGGVPIMLSLKMPSEVQGVERASKEDTYAQIVKDFKEAAVDLPSRSEQDPKDVGHATRGAALGFLAKAYLYSGNYEEAEKVLQELCCRGSFAGQTPEYKLMDDFSKVWNIDYNNNDESLFEIQTLDDTQYGLGERYSVVVGSRDDSGWAWGQPTSDLENAFKAQGDEIRLKYTILHDGQTDVPGDPTWNEDNPYVVSASKHKSGRCNMKLFIPVGKRPSPYDAAHNPLNIRLLRYAEVLLMYAEVENQLGHDSEAQWALNEVRGRVHLSAVTTTGKELRDAIRAERRLELALEGTRLDDLRRWKMDDGKTMMEHVFGPNGSFVKYNMETSTDPYETTNQIENSNEGINFQAPRDLLFAIPNSEITMSNGSIKQNPGYN